MLGSSHLVSEPGYEPRGRMTRTRPALQTATEAPRVTELEQHLGEMEGAIGDLQYQLQAPDAQSRAVDEGIYSEWAQFAANWRYDLKSDMRRIEFEFKDEVDQMMKQMENWFTGTEASSNVEKPSVEQTSCFSTPATCSTKCQKEDKGPSKVLLVTVHNVRYSVDNEVLQQVFSKHGHVEKISIVQEFPTFQALIHYRWILSAALALNSFHGRNIYDGCCNMDISFASIDLKETSGYEYGKNKSSEAAIEVSSPPMSNQRGLQVSSTLAHTTPADEKLDQQGNFLKLEPPSDALGLDSVGSHCSSQDVIIEKMKNSVESIQKSSKTRTCIIRRKNPDEVDIGIVDSPASQNARKEGWEAKDDMASTLAVQETDSFGSQTVTEGNSQIGVWVRGPNPGGTCHGMFNSRVQQLFDDSRSFSLVIAQKGNQHICFENEINNLEESIIIGGSVGMAVSDTKSKLVGVNLCSNVTSSNVADVWCFEKWFQETDLNSLKRTSGKNNTFGNCLCWCIGSSANGNWYNSILYFSLKINKFHTLFGYSPHSLNLNQAIFHASLLCPLHSKHSIHYIHFNIFPFCELPGERKKTLSSLIDISHWNILSCQIGISCWLESSFGHDVSLISISSQIPTLFLLVLLPTVGSLLYWHECDMNQVKGATFSGYDCPIRCMILPVVILLGKESFKGSIGSNGSKGHDLKEWPNTEHMVWVNAEVNGINYIVSDCIKLNSHLPKHKSERWKFTEINAVFRKLHRCANKKPQVAVLEVHKRILQYVKSSPSWGNADYSFAMVSAKFWCLSTGGIIVEVAFTHLSCRLIKEDIITTKPLVPILKMNSRFLNLNGVSCSYVVILSPLWIGNPDTFFINCVESRLSVQVTGNGLLAAYTTIVAIIRFHRQLQLLMYRSLWKIKSSPLLHLVHDHEKFLVQEGPKGHIVQSMDPIVTN